MRTSKPLITVLLFMCLISHAQQNPNKIIFENYTNINVDFFTTENTTYQNKPLYKALRAKIYGDENNHLKYLSKSLDDIKDGELKGQVGKLLYFGYLNQRKRDKAIVLDKNIKELNFNVNSNIVAKKADYPKTKIITPTNKTEVDFDQFYFDAVIQENDTIRVFFDTCAPGISVKQDLVDKYKWETDTTYYGYSVLAAMGVTFKEYSVLIPKLKIGDFKLQNLPASYRIMSEEQEQSLKDKGIEDHNILLGLNVFEDLIDGVEFDFENEKLILTKSLPKKENEPNFMMVDSKPAISFQLSGKRHTAFLDTGSPRHILPDKLITEDNSYFKTKGNYGDFQYDIFYVEYDQVLNLKDVWLDTADYGGFEVSDTFNIDALFGSFLGRKLSFDFRNRQVKLSEK